MADEYAADLSGGPLSLSATLRLIEAGERPPLVAWLATFTGTDYRFWSGDAELVFDGETYLRGHFFGISPAETTAEAPRKRLSVTFPVTDNVLREDLLQDPGPLTVAVNWIYSLDQGSTWFRLPRKFVGRLSRPVIRNGLYTIEIETYGGDVDRGVPRKWSDDDQQSRHAGDVGLEYLRQLASGLETRWPP